MSCRREFALILQYTLNSSHDQSSSTILTMGKINKKSEKKVKNVLRLKKDVKKIKTKDCFVHLIQMSQEEVEIYRSSDEIVTKSFSLRIKDDALYISNNYNTQRSTNNTFSIQLKKRLSDIVLEHCSPDITVNPIIKESNAARKMLNPPSLSSLITSAWTKCKRDFKTTSQTLNLGDIVMAKMATFSPWPSRIESFTQSKKKRANVFFFGDGRHGIVDVAEIVPFADCHEMIRIIAIRKVSAFHKGVSEVESLFGIPSELSLLNPVSSIQ